MKLKMYFLLLALGALGLQSCNDDDDHLSSVPTELKNAFTEKYPSVSNEKWETKGNYYIAEFVNRTTKPQPGLLRTEYGK